MVVGAAAEQAPSPRRGVGRRGIAAHRLLGVVAIVDCVEFGDGVGPPSGGIETTSRSTGRQ